MVKPVKVGIPAAHPRFPPLPNPLEKHVSKVAQPLSKGRPTSPPPPIPKIIDQDSKETLLRLKVDRVHKTMTPTFIPPLTKTPLDKTFLKATLSKAEKADIDGEEASAFKFYEQAMHLLSSSILDTQGLLLAAICYLKTAQFVRNHEKDSSTYTMQAYEYVESLNEKLLGDNIPEKNDASFMCSLGAAQLILARSGPEESYYAIAKNSFLKALKLIETPRLPKRDLETLNQRVRMGLGLCFLYLARSEILVDGTQKRDRFLEFLKLSRLHLEIAISLHPTDLLKYTLALNYSWTGLLLEEREKVELKKDAKNQLYQQSKANLHKALEILNPISPKTPHMLALLGTLEYKMAYFYKDIDYALGYEAFQHMSLASSTHLGSEDDSLLISCGDSLRQLAWVCPIDIFQQQSEDWLNKILEESNQEMEISESMKVAFDIQISLWELLYSTNKLNEPKKERQTTSKANENPENFNELQRTFMKNLQDQDIRIKKVGLKTDSEDLEENPLVILQRVETLEKNALMQQRMIQSQTKNTAEEIIILNNMKKIILSHLTRYRDLKEMILNKMRKNALEDLKKYISKFQAILKTKSQDIYFEQIKYDIIKFIHIIEKKFLDLTISCDTPEELRAYNNHVRYIGNNLDGIFVSTLFKWMLTKRLRSFEILLELESDFI